MMLRKSILEGYLYCPFSFKLEYILDKKATWIPPVMEVGTKFHNAHHEYYKNVDCEKLAHMQSVEEVQKYVRSLLPSEEFLNLQTLCNNFAQFESNRYWNLRKQQKSDYYMPMYVEQYFCNWKERKHGTFDRADRTLDGEYAIGEIKTGHLHWASVKRELQFYIKGTRGLGLFPKEPVYVFGYSPLDNEVKFERVSNVIYKWLDVYEQRFWDALEDDYFPANVGPQCGSCMWHEFFDLCDQHRKIQPRAVEQV